MPSQTLSLTQSQQLQMVLAPQLRQSLEMLQAPILELRAMVQQEMEQNPAIEEVLNDSTSLDADTENGKVEKQEELDFDKEFEVLAKLDDEWRDYFFQNVQNTSYSSEDAEKRQFMLDSLPQRVLEVKGEGATAQGSRSVELPLEVLEYPRIVLGVGGQGVIPERDNDTFGIGYYHLSLSNGMPDMFHSEQGVECYYNIEVTPWMHVTPDLQVIVNPGGTDDNDVALVGGLRVHLSL